MLRRLRNGEIIGSVRGVYPTELLEERTHERP